MTKKISLRKAVPEDAEAYLAFEKKVSGKTYFATVTLGDALENINEGRLYMIESGDVVIGHIAYGARGEDAVYISDFVIDLAYQGQGIGREVLKSVLEELQHVQKIWLLTHPENTSAVKLYESVGFKITDRKNDYFGDGEPRIILALSH